MPPNLLPMVATGKSNIAVAAAAPATAMSMPGQWGRAFFSPTITATDAMEVTTAAGSNVGAWRQSIESFSKNGPGSAPSGVNPKSSLI